MFKLSSLVFVLSFVLLASPAANADILVETCNRQVLTPVERTEKSDIVFEGKVRSASCLCHALASGEDEYGPEVECTDVIDVIKVMKGEVGPDFTMKNLIMIDPDPNASMSRGACQDLVDERDKKEIGENDIYYLTKNGDHFETVPVSACE